MSACICRPGDPEGWYREDCPIHGREAADEAREEAEAALASALQDDRLDDLPPMDVHDLAPLLLTWLAEDGWELVRCQRAVDVLPPNVGESGMTSPGTVRPLDEARSRLYAWLADCTRQPDGTEWTHDRLRVSVEQLLSRVREVQP